MANSARISALYRHTKILPTLWFQNLRSPTGTECRWENWSQTRVLPCSGVTSTRDQLSRLTVLALYSFHPKCQATLILTHKSNVLFLRVYSDLGNRSQRNWSPCSEQVIFVCFSCLFVMYKDIQTAHETQSLNACGYCTCVSKKSVR